MAEEVLGRGITKFNGPGFPVWKFEMTQLLMAHGLEDLIDGSRLRPAGERIEAVKAWVKDNAKAMSLISTSMERTQLQDLITCRTAYEMWQNLTRMYEQKSASSKLLLMQRYREYRMAPNDSVVQHVTHIKNLVSQLRDVGQQVDETDIMAKILGSIPAKYNTLVTAWDSIPPANQTVGNLLERLIKKESKMNAEDQFTGALAVVSYNKRGGSRNSRNRQDGTKTRNGEKPQIECFYCKKNDHIARDCRKKKRDNKDKSERNQNGNSAFATLTSTGNRQSDKRSELSHEAVCELTSTDPKEIWITDSGASCHITFRREWLTDFEPTDGDTVSLGDNGQREVRGKGVVHIKKLINGQWIKSQINNVLYVPSLRKNLFSAGVCASNGYKVTFGDRKVTLTRKDIAEAIGLKGNNNMYTMLFKVTEQSAEVNMSTTSLREWHEKLGHINKQTLKSVVDKQAVKGVKFSCRDDFFCESCQHGKAHRLEFKDSEKQSWKPGEYIHTDVCGPFSEESIGGSRFYLLFIDEASDYRVVYFLKHKSDVFERLRDYERMVANKFGRNIKVLRADNGREYSNNATINYLKSHGIILENTAPYTPEQNGKAERENRTIVENARTMVHAKGLSKRLWAEAVNTAVYLLNRTLIAKNKDVTPYELWCGRKPNLSHAKIFGTNGYVHIDKQFRKKMDEKARKYVMVGYQGESTNYRMYDPESDKVIVSRNVVFDEIPKQLPLPNISPGIRLPVDKDVPDRVNKSEVPEQQGEENEELFTASDWEANESSDMETPSPPRRLKDRDSIRRPKRYKTNIIQYDTPTSFQEAITGSEAKEWSRAVENELAAHERNNT